MKNHWMIYVGWDTIVKWKERIRNDDDDKKKYPYQYSSDNRSFANLRRGDVLWIITTPRFDEEGKRSRTGRPRPPAVMARIRVDDICCNCHSKKQGRPCPDDLKKCTEPGVLPEGVHIDSGDWSIVAIGQKDKDPEERSDVLTQGALEKTYPMLYNFFAALPKLEFETKWTKFDLSVYLDWVQSRDFRNPRQKKTGVTNKSSAGPYWPIGEIFQSPLKLSSGSGDVMDEFHLRSVQGRNIFVSYKWDDLEHISQETGMGDKENWISELYSELEAARFNAWIDQFQISQKKRNKKEDHRPGSLGGLLDEILRDAEHQAGIFVALVTPDYQSGWALTEWMNVMNAKNRSNGDPVIPVFALSCGGNLRELPGTPTRSADLGSHPTPAEVASKITRFFNETGGPMAWRKH